MGLWGPWTHTEFKGKPVDFWNLKAGMGTVRFAGFASQASGPVFGEFQAKQEHVVLNQPGGEKVALNENLHVRVWSLGGPDAKAYILDYVSTQRCASTSASNGGSRLLLPQTIRPSLLGVVALPDSREAISMWAVCPPVETIVWLSQSWQFQLTAVSQQS